MISANNRKMEGRLFKKSKNQSRCHAFSEDILIGTEENVLHLRRIFNLLEISKSVAAWTLDSDTGITTEYIYW
jgi:hypothetical protein